MTKIPVCQCRRHKRCRFNTWVKKIPCSRKWQPTPVFLPGEFHGPRSLTGYNPWGCKESNTTEATEHALIFKATVLEREENRYRSIKVVG